MRLLVSGLLAALLLACGPKPRYIPDAGPEDAGVDAGEVDAGRPRGDDPPTGWMTAVPLPADAGVLTHLGASVASAPDRYGQPLIAGVYDDPNGDGVRQDTTVFFTRWNGADGGAFDPIKTVEVVGPVDLGHPHRQVAIARDDVTGRIGIAYVKGADTVRFAWSDDEGANFSLQTVSPTGATGVSDPQLALHDGTLYLAFSDSNGLTYRQRVGDSGAFSDSRPPAAGGAAAAVAGPSSLVLDGAGHPGLAYFGAGASLAETLIFWRPGAATATAVADSAGVDVQTVPDRAPSVSLTFSGELPRLAYHLRNQEPLATADDTPELFYAAATDAAGASWGTPVAIPRNGNGATFNSTQWYQAVVVDASGKVRVAADYAAHGIVGGQCGGPKLATSADGTQFTTCAPPQSPFNFAGEWISGWAHAPGKLTLVFDYDSRSNPSIGAGVIMWREP